jgi:hypothetical protein
LLRASFQRALFQDALFQDALFQGLYLFLCGASEFMAA